jgi:hypothetical protein
VALVVASWALPFEWIERVFGYLGLGLLVFAVAAIKLHPDWGSVAHGFVPGHHAGGSLSVYLYFVVGLLGAAMTPYEVYFYSSGAVEDGWGLKELGLNKVTSTIGYGLGGFLSFSLMIVAGVLFLPQKIDPQFLGTPPLAAADTLGQVGLLLALVGILFAVGGAAIETSFSGGLQHGPVLRLALGQEGAARRGLALHARVARDLRARLPRGHDRLRPGQADGVLGHLLGGGTAAHLSPDPPGGQRPQLHGLEGEREAGQRARRLYFVVILAIAVAAIPLMLLTNGGQG